MQAAGVNHVQCYWCFETFKCEGATLCANSTGPIDRLQCGHMVCHQCLLESFALSLASPNYMPPRCCQPIIGHDLGRLLVPPEVNEAWMFMYEFTDRMRTKPWVCPGGHLSSPMVTDTALPMWGKLVSCRRCTPSLLNGPVDRALFCLFCKEEACRGICVQHHYNAIYSFVRGMRFVNPREARMAWQFQLHINELDTGNYTGGWQLWPAIKNEFGLRQPWLQAPDTLVSPARPLHQTEDASMAPAFQYQNGSTKSLNTPKMSDPSIPEISATETSDGSSIDEYLPDTRGTENLNTKFRYTVEGYKAISVRTRDHPPKASHPGYLERDRPHLHLRPPPPHFPSANQPGYGDIGNSAPHAKVPPGSFCGRCNEWMVDCQCVWPTQTSDFKHMLDRLDAEFEMAHAYKPLGPERFTLARTNGYSPPNRKAHGLRFEEVDAWRPGSYPRLL